MKAQRCNDCGKIVAFSAFHLHVPILLCYGCWEEKQKEGAR